MKKNKIRISLKPVFFDGVKRGVDIFEIIQDHKILQRFMIKEDAEAYLKRLQNA